MLRLFTTAYNEQNPHRREEYAQCLRRNLNCPALDEICLLAEGKDDTLPRSTKIRIKSVHARPSYADYFAWIDEVAGPDDVSVIANGDIWFDETIGAAAKALRIGDCFTLARWDAGTLCDRNDCQDSWIFRGKVGNVRGDFPVGVPRCDNRVLHELHQAGYRLFNPAFSIRIHHLHSGIRQEYPGGHQPEYVDPPYRYIWPHNLFSPLRTALHNLVHPHERVGYRVDRRRIARSIPLLVLRKVAGCLLRPDRKPVP